MKSAKEPQSQSYTIIWVEPDFLRSPGLFHIVNTAKLLPGVDGINEEQKTMRALARVGGVALQGHLVGSIAGGLRIGSPKYKDLELTIPWRFIRGVATVHKSRKKLSFVARAALGADSITRPRTRQVS
jgi:hypothetical protein